MNVTKPLPLSAVRIQEGFWRTRIDNVIREVIPYQWKALNDQIPGAEPSHSIENFKIASGESQGAFYGLIFQDSDVGKWIEAASYGLIDSPDSALEEAIDAVVELIARSQEPDGYIDTYFSVAAPDKKWSDFAMGHEMYCGGHLIEGAIAYFQATGKRRFLDVMLRYADHLASRFGLGPGQTVAFCGHPEIELALYKLYEVTKEERYRDLSQFFVDERGRHPGVIDNDKVIQWGAGGPTLNPWHQKDYYLDHAPVRQQDHADGHAVRAMYLYCAMADQWRLTGDQTLGRALEKLWDNATQKRMYVTGGLGSQGVCERFTVDHDLPSDTAYAETCASIGLIFWAWRMTLASPHRRYADILERALYNGALSGISLDGTRYFYVNPLEVVPELVRARKDHEHVKTGRVEWFGCACCPPNIARLVCSVGQFLYSHGDGVWVHQFASAKADLNTEFGRVALEQRSEYPWNGKTTFLLTETPASAWSLRVRVPGIGAKFTINGQPAEFTLDEGGYAVVRRIWAVGDTVELTFDLPVRVLRSHPLVRETSGLAVVQRGPFVYCAEEADNGGRLHLVTIAAQGFEESFDPVLGVTKLTVPGRRVVVDETAPLYSEASWTWKDCEVTLVPYYAWGNRGEGEMRVWLNAD